VQTVSAQLLLHVLRVVLLAAAGVAAVRLFLDTSNVRAWPGGVGQFKIGGNYAPTVTPQSAAKQRHDCSQVSAAEQQELGAALWFLATALARVAQQQLHC
jgi:hypothetical protein